MPVLTKEFELEDGTKLLVRQAGGMSKLRIENIQAQVFRDHIHFGMDTTKWTDEQQQQYLLLWIYTIKLPKQQQKPKMVMRQLHDAIKERKGENS